VQPRQHVAHVAKGIVRVHFYRAWSPPRSTDREGGVKRPK
jgi:hypothetical protein